MKKLLSFVAILAVVATLLPAECLADLRGSFGPISLGQAGDGIGYTSGLFNGIQTPALRPAPFGAGDGYTRVERWFAFTHRSTVVGFETTREIWQGLNRQQSGFTVATIAAARSPLLLDPSAQISYTDPAWSPDGRFLAYVQTDPQVTQSAIYVQEYMVSTTMSVAITPVGGPMLVVPLAPGVHNRHPDWSPDGTTLVYDSDATGLSVDLYKVQVFPPPVGSPVRLTFVDSRAEQNPAWAPDGIRVAYDTNRFGPNVIEILDTSTGSITLAETAFASVAHSNPDWSSDGASIYYEAPQREDAQATNNIWRIDPATQAKCEIIFDANGDGNVSVSGLVNTTREGINYNTFLFESSAAGFGLIVWRGNPINSCIPPLPMGVAISPRNLDLASTEDDVTLHMQFPPETVAAGYQCSAANGPNEGVRMRTTIFVSPTLFGIRAKHHPNPGLFGLPQFDQGGGNFEEASISVKFERRRLISRLVALGLTNADILVPADAYSNISGRTFRGFAPLRIVQTTAAGSIVMLEQNSPNPFNPATKIRFAVSKPGNVSLRVFNVRGELVKTLANGHYENGLHEVSWDGRNASGRSVSSGVYYAKVMGEGGNTDVMKMVMAK
jgi:hypothetical protein